MTNAIVLGGSRGIGKAISESLKSIKIDVFAASKNDIDTSNLTSVKKFLEIHNQTEIIIKHLSLTPGSTCLFLPSDIEYVS